MDDEQIWRFIFSLTVAFPAIAGIIRFKKVDNTYMPFLIYVIISLLNELIVGILNLPADKKALTVNNNLFILFESLILFVQFYYWKRFKNYRNLFSWLIAFTITGWVSENIIAHSIFHFHSIFLISYSFVLVLLSVQTINYIIVNEGRVPLTKNAKFIICTAMIVFFVYNIFVQTFVSVMWMNAKIINGERVYDKVFVANIFAIEVYVNAFTNLLYGIGVCLIPKKTIDKDLFKGLIEE